MATTTKRHVAYNLGFYTTIRHNQEKQQAHDLQPSKSLKKESNVGLLKQSGVLITGHANTSIETAVQVVDMSANQSVKIG